MKKTLLFFLGLFFSLIIKAQETPPEVSRFLQVNTYNGGQLSHISVDDKNNGYICGIANGKNFNFDGFKISPVGIDDLFVSKINSEGKNQWIRTVNASDNGIIACSRSFINPAGEVYVSGSFSGKITFGGETISSVATSYYLLKYDLNGNEKWIEEYPSQVIDIANENNKTFVTYGKQFLSKLDDNTGLEIFSKTFASLDIKALELRNNSLYIAGQATQWEVFIDTESVYLNNGFVLKSDLDFNVNDLVRFVPSGGNPNYISTVNDIKFVADGNLVIVGVSNNKVLFGIEDSVPSVSANNETNFTTNGGYILLAKINANLDTLQWFKTGTNMSTNFNMNIADDRMANLEIFPYGSSWFRVLLKKKFDNFQQYSLPTGLTATSDDKSVMFAVSFTGSDYNGTFALSKDQYYAYGISNNNANSLFLNYNKSNNNAYVFNDSATWGKFILDSEFGTLSSNYIKHTGTDGSLINYTYQCGKTNYFGSQLNNIKSPSNNTGCSNIISKIAPNGNLVWKSQLVGATQSESYPNRSGNISDTRMTGENVVVSEFSSQVNFVDSNNVTTNIVRQNTAVNNYISLVTNLNSDGTLKWAKKLEPTTTNKKIKINSVAYDNNGNVIFSGVTDDMFLIDDVAYNFNKNKILFLIKFDSNSGNIIFVKQFKDIDTYTLNLDTDSQDNIYLSFEPLSQQTSYNFGNLQIPYSLAGVDHLFVKFDSNGNALLGKNFYANNLAGDYNYSWPLSLKFDGENFIISGEMYSQNRTNYKGIDGQTYNNPYSTYNLSDFIAKVDKLGNVIWHKPIFGNNRIIQNKADIDNLGNVYYYIGTLGNINIDGNETSFPTDKRSTAMVKLSATDGSLKYLKNLGIHTNYTYNSSLSVLQNDILSFSGNVDNQDQFLYPINNHNASNYYIATLGKLPTPYLTPKDNYLLVANIEVPNNITDNTGEFDLITNVDWTATSNLNWLTISSEKYTSKNQTSTTTISGSGDHKIKLSASQNLTGFERTAIITLAGNGVSSKEIIVKQSATLGITEISEKRILIYPNPTKDIVFLESKEIINSLELYDLQGKLLKQQNCNSKKVQVSIQDLPNAVYLVKAKTNKGVETFKVIKN